MKEYYQQRLYWIFHYTGKSFWYCVAKTLCLIVGVPLYAVMFVVEMVITAINMIFTWIPVLNVVVTVICKALITVVGSTFYICILPDLKQYRKITGPEVEYEVLDVVADTSDESQQAFEEVSNADDIEG